MIHKRIEYSTAQAIYELDFLDPQRYPPFLKMEEEVKTNYCLYARKSSESDERQAMSIGSQIKEMRALAKRNSLEILETYQESHSAKTDDGKVIA